MKDVVWKEGSLFDGFMSYYAKVGSLEVFCSPDVRYHYRDYKRKFFAGWEAAVWTGDKFVRSPVVRKSLKAAKSDAEKLVTEYLLSIGASMITELKLAGVLDEAMSIAGID